MTVACVPSNRLSHAKSEFLLTTVHRQSHSQRSARDKPEDKLSQGEGVLRESQRVPQKRERAPFVTEKGAQNLGFNYCYIRSA